jgi:predicted LPLAT superfamily acyltransferase
VSATQRPRWAEKAERGSGVALRLLIRIVRWLGPGTSRLLLHPIAAYFLLTDGEARRASRAYFERLARLPDGRAALGHAPGWRDTYRHLLEFSTSLFDRMCVWAGQDEGFELRHEAQGHFAHLPDAEPGRANSLGKGGALIASAHFGTFDMMRSICMEAQVPVRAVMYGDNAETINRFFAGLNPDLDLDLIHIRPGQIGASFEIRDAIRAGAFVVIMGDRVPPGGGGAQRAAFLGEPARFPTGPFELAALLGCPLMVASAVRVGPATYRVDSEPLYPGGRVPRAEREKVVQEMVERYAAILERACLRTPYQWFNFFDFWA